MSERRGSRRRANAFSIVMLAGLVLASSGRWSVEGAPAPVRTLSFEERVGAEEAIARVRHAHQLGETRPFEAAVPRPVLEARVRKFLRQSDALQRYWRWQVTAEMLRAETERMARDTRMPDRLAELYAALGDDPILIQECLVRPILTERLLRNLVASDEPAAEVDAHGPDRQRAWEAWWRGAEARLDPGPVAVVATAWSPAAHLPAPAPSAPAGCAAANTWNNASLDDDPEPRDDVAAVWTGTEMLAWGGDDTTANYGVRYDPALDSWSFMSTLNAPPPRTNGAAVWTGARMVIWGGFPTTNTGGRYDPATDSWSPTSTLGAPPARSGVRGVWTGSRVVVWGGYDGTYLNTGGRYDPVNDAWTPTSPAGAPAGRQLHTLVWTGSRMIVWGGAAGGPPFNTGGQYDPVMNVWVPTATLNAPTARTHHAAVWTGHYMVVWGSVDSLNTGGRYDPGSDLWLPTSTLDAPAGRYNHSAVWSEDRMIVWGGQNGAAPMNTGGRYDPENDSWAPTSLLNVPPARQAHAAVWTGDRMVVWGGNNFALALNSGGRYDPETDTWTPTFLHGAPSVRRGSSAVWSGNEMIIWGGDEGRTPLASGARYDPATDGWTPTTSEGAPEARSGHTAVWSGTEMIVWGGAAPFFPPQSTGGRYDPLLDSWTPTADVGAPEARTLHTAIWTGSRMIIWGGDFGGNLNTGAAYAPDADTWTPLTITGAPSPRSSHTAVWTGSRMIVWGGSDGIELSTGGRYDPGTDTWTATSITGAPATRKAHTAVWTGRHMIIWGGFRVSFQLNSGSRYDPVNDTWVATASNLAPTARQDQAGVWTGSAMIVWGGIASPAGGTYFNTGGLYDPVANTWSVTSTTAAPSPRSAPRAVWTGNALLVWGGIRSGAWFTTGGQYCACTTLVESWYQDADGDGYGDPGVLVPSCAAPAGFVSNGDDCDDQRGTIFPGAQEICDGRDDDCDGGVDEGGDALCADLSACTSDQCQGAGGCLNAAVPDGTPCDDGTDCTIGDLCAAGACGVPRDADGDAHPDASCGGDDCDDTDAQVWSPPSEASGVMAVSSSPVTFAWNSQATHGPGTLHDLVGGTRTSASMNFPAAECLYTDVAATFADVRPDPPPGAVYWYLVRGRNTCGTGTYGSPSRDSQIPACP